MDLILLVVGIVLLLSGAKQRDPDGRRTGGGFTMMTIGIILTFLGAVWFGSAFMKGFKEGYERAKQRQQMNQTR